MLQAPLLRRRIISRKSVGLSVVRCRRYAGRNGMERRTTHYVPPAENKSLDEEGTEASNGSENKKDAGPSLYEQLFPDQYEAEMKKKRESKVPRLPVKQVVRPVKQVGAVDSRRSRAVDAAEDARRSPESLRMKRHMESQPSETTVLVLRNASKSLLEEDFKRIIPQGKHLPGWRLDQGDILGVVPGRDLDTLEQANFYYILFSSPLSAFTYQGHATRIHRIVASHTPASIHSAIPPPPGLTIEGMDAHAAIESFTLVPPTQSIDLRQLKPPLPPFLERLIKNRGYSKLVSRKDRLPYEARLTLDGPQLHMSAVKHVLLETARDRGLSWSGGDSLAPRLTKWEPRLKDDDSIAKDTRSQEHADAVEGTDQQKRRTPLLVYVVGFHTERAMQSFVHYWHRRPMKLDTDKRNNLEAAELPPIANVEVLW